MWLAHPGRVSERIDFLGTNEFCLYLIKGDHGMLIGGGASCVGPSLEAQLSATDFDLRRISYVVIPHSHFDHCGAVPYLKRKLPWIQVVASPYSHEVFGKEKVLSFLATANRELIEAAGLLSEYDTLGLQFDGIQVDRVVTEGDVFDLGQGIRAQIMETPGHSRCCIGVYIPALKAVFPSDAAPCPTADGAGLVLPSPQYDFALYLRSLARMAALDVELCCFDHYGAFTGDEARGMLSRALQQTERFRDDVLQQWQRTQDKDRIVARILAAATRKGDIGFLSTERWTSIMTNVVSKVLATSV